MGEDLPRNPFCTSQPGNGGNGNGGSGGDGSAGLPSNGGGCDGGRCGDLGAGGLANPQQGGWGVLPPGALPSGIIPIKWGTGCFCCTLTYQNITGFATKTYVVRWYYFFTCFHSNCLVSGWNFISVTLGMLAQPAIHPCGMGGWEVPEGTVLSVKQLWQCPRSWLSYPPFHPCPPFVDTKWRTIVCG